MAIAGNIIDLDANSSLTDEDIQKSLQQAFTEIFFGSIDKFRHELEKADSILYLADNAGEIVFDRLLIKQISPQRVTLAVRGGPIINDATMHDAHFAGLDQLIHVINNGSNAPGTLLDDCSSEFREYF